MSVLTITPLDRPVALPADPTGQVMLVGFTNDLVPGALVAECDGFTYFLTPCCSASATGVAVTDANPHGIACRACYAPVDPRLGGVPQL